MSAFSAERALTTQIREFEMIKTNIGSSIEKKRIEYVMKENRWLL